MRLQLSPTLLLVALARRAISLLRLRDARERPRNVVAASFAVEQSVVRKVTAQRPSVPSALCNQPTITQSNSQAPDDNPLLVGQRLRTCRLFRQCSRVESWRAVPSRRRTLLACSPFEPCHYWTIVPHGHTCGPLKTALQARLQLLYSYM